MAVTLDPYRRWLGIPAGRRPPTHYQLLGIANHEFDPEVINAAVIRQSAYVRNFQTGPYADEATRILGEIASAKACLADPAQRTAYDAELWRTQPPSPANAPPPVHAAARAPAPVGANVESLWPAASSQQYAPGISPGAYAPGAYSQPVPPQAAWGGSPPPLWAQQFPTGTPRRSIPVWVWAVGAMGSCTVVALVAALAIALRWRDQPVAVAGQPSPAAAAIASPDLTPPSSGVSPSAGAPSSPAPPSSTAAPPAAVASSSSPPAAAASASQPAAAAGAPPASAVGGANAPTGQPTSLAGAGPISFDDSLIQLQRFTDLRWGLKSLAFSPDGGRVAAGKMDRAIMLFDVDKGTRLAYVEDLESLGEVTSCAFSPDGAKLLTGGYSGAIIVWDVDSAGSLRQSGQFSGHTKEITCQSVSPNGGFVLSGSTDKTLRYWELGTRRELQNWRDFKNNVLACQILSDGTALATDGISAIKVNLATGETLRTTAMGGYARLAAISPDGRYLARDDNYDIEVWDLERGGHVATIDNNETNWSFAFAPDNSYLVSGGRGHINVWDMTGYRRILAVDTGTIFYTYPLTISPDGRHIAVYPQAAGQDLVVVRLPPPTR